jgi:hypothetical protein
LLHQLFLLVVGGHEAEGAFHVLELSLKVGHLFFFFLDGLLLDGKDAA